MKIPPTLRAFQRCDDPVRVVRGPFGSGKSSACVIEFPRRAQAQRPSKKGVRRSRWAAIRNTYPQLRDTTRKTFSDWIPDAIGQWNEQSFTWRGEWNDGERDVDCEILFRALDRPEHIRNLLSLELTGAYVNEAREIPKLIVDGLEGRVGRFPPASEEGCTWSGIWMDSNPWHPGHWLAKQEAKGVPGWRFFRQPGGRAANAENVDNLPKCWDRLVKDCAGSDSDVAAAKAEQAARLTAGKHEDPCICYYLKLCRGKDSEYIRVYVDGEDASGDVGAVFGAWIAAIQSPPGSPLRVREGQPPVAGRLCSFDHPKTGVFTSWDLGHADATAIWWWRINSDRQVDILDHYENSGQGLAHYLDVVDGKGYAYECHWLPHDARAKTLATQQTVAEQCTEHWRGKAQVAITPDIGLDDGIGAARWLLEQPIRIHERCAAPGRFEYSGVDALAGYRFEWDEANQCFSRQPLHNWASHTADAFRYLAVLVRRAEQITRPATASAGPAPRPPSLDEAWQLHERERAERGA